MSSPPISISHRLFLMQRRSCKLSFLFPPRRQSAPESLPSLWNVTLTKKFNVNVKITASWPTVILPKRHVKLYKLQKWTIKRLTRFHNPQNDFNPFYFSSSFSTRAYFCICNLVPRVLSYPPHGARERARRRDPREWGCCICSVIFKKKKKTLCFFSSLLICPLARLKPPTSFPGENPGNEVVKPPASQVSQAIELYVNLCVKFSKCKVRRPPLSEI